VTTAGSSTRLFRLEPEFRVRVWGGRRLRVMDGPIGEAWIAYGASRVSGGRHAGRTVDHLVGDDPSGLLGRDVTDRHGSRFPLLLKFIDTADWLSVQVHPTDAQAGRLVGPGESGKTEAWHVLEAAPGAVGRVGVRPGTRPDELVAAIRSGRVLDLLRPLAFEVGQTVLVPAGTIHTIGPGILLYEAQQASDATFRAWDWNRPAGPDRPLHVEEAAAVADVAAVPVVAPLPRLDGTSIATVAACEHFRLDLVQLAEAPLGADTAGRSFHLLTVFEGRVEVTAGHDRMELEPRETVLVAGGAGDYRVTAAGGTGRVMRASVSG
jgi:mannose-6-phosphate isomerase